MRTWQKLNLAPIKVGIYTLLKLDGDRVEVWRKTEPHTYRRDAYGTLEDGKLKLTFENRIHPTIINHLQNAASPQD